MDTNRIGKILTELRGEMSVTEAAYHYGVSASSVSMYENGLRVPRDEVKIRIARHYGLTVGEIFFPNDCDNLKDPLTGGKS